MTGYADIGLCDIDNTGSDVVEKLSYWIEKYDPKMEHAFTPEVVNEIYDEIEKRERIERMITTLGNYFKN
jgi:hypothetical protein